VIQETYLAVRRSDDGRFAKKEINQVCTLLYRQPLEQGQGAFRASPKCKMDYLACSLLHADVHFFCPSVA
jgi:hypothetical protein